MRRAVRRNGHGAGCRVRPERGRVQHRQRLRLQQLLSQQRQLRRAPDAGRPGTDRQPDGHYPSGRVDVGPRRHDGRRAAHHGRRGQNHTGRRSHPGHGRPSVLRQIHRRYYREPGLPDERKRRSRRQM